MLQGDKPCDLKHSLVRQHLQPNLIDTDRCRDSHMLPTVRARTIAVLVFSFSCYACYVYAKLLTSRSTPPLQPSSSPSVRVVEPQRDWTQRNWAQYSPYFPVAAYPAPPANCNITEVSIAQTARVATRGQCSIVHASCYLYVEAELSGDHATMIPLLLSLQGRSH